MEWLSRLKGMTVAIVTAPFIYFVERSSRYYPVVLPLFQKLDLGEFSGVTSTLTVLEVSVHPLRTGNASLARSYRDILLAGRNLTTLDVTEDIAVEAARLRATLNLKTPDAIQLATALVGGASVFVTNDRSLGAIPGISILCLDDIVSPTS
jgi:predicted nucleic acid-binding protein